MHHVIYIKGLPENAPSPWKFKICDADALGLPFAGASIAPDIEALMSIASARVTAGLLTERIHIDGPTMGDYKTFMLLSHIDLDGSEHWWSLTLNGPNAGVYGSWLQIHPSKFDPDLTSDLLRIAESIDSRIPTDWRDKIREDWRKKPPVRTMRFSFISTWHGLSNHQKMTLEQASKVPIAQVLSVQPNGASTA
jgi:hypothetical protein